MFFVAEIMQRLISADAIKKIRPGVSMKQGLNRSALFLSFAIMTSACGGKDGDGESPGVTRSDVARHYADLVHANYTTVLTEAQALQTAIEAFVAAPSEETHGAAKNAWLAARDSYGQSEAFRFYGGPIDADNGPEARINAWPLDEAYVDYVEGNAAAGIVNKTDIEITKERLASLNEGGESDVLGTGAGFDPEKAIATGYHALEFLLWGQDRFADSAGRRSYKDFLTTADATAPNGERRSTYLKVAGELLIMDLQSLVDAWDPAKSGNYRETWLTQSPDDALKKMITAIGTLAKGELAGERIDTALSDTKDQEDEHSCFSDNTHNDIIANTQGVRNVYTGTFGAASGASLSTLVKQINPALDAEMMTLLDEALTLAQALPAPFDQVIIKPESDEAYKKADALVLKLGAAADKLVQVASELGLGVIGVELPE